MTQICYQQTAVIYYTEISFDIIPRIASILSKCDNLNIIKNVTIKKEINCFCYKISANYFKNYLSLLPGEPSEKKLFSIYLNFHL